MGSFNLHVSRKTLIVLTDKKTMDLNSKKLKMNLVPFLIPLLCLTTAHSPLTTKYYKNLIFQEIVKAQSYQLPQRNEEFSAGLGATPTQNFGTYDFIIIGAGSAGSVLATRLSEIDDWNILLLEAGGEEDDFSNIPAMFPFLQFSDKNWGYYTTPQTTCCLGMKDQKCFIPRGKVIGGCSSINAVMYARGNPQDYDKWGTGWSYDDILPYFMKSENCQIDGDPGFHGKGGSWNVEYAVPHTFLHEVFANASAESGAPIHDYNGCDQMGSSKTQFNTIHGRRQSLATAFLDDARKRRNLEVVTKALVTRINLNKAKVAQGVEFITEDSKFSARATKEVIVSGGAINSPQLLMLSGIGPRDHLQDLGIKVVVDLPVGKNLLEHPLFPALYFSTNYAIPDQTIEEKIDQYLQGLDILTTAGNIGGLGFGNPRHNVPTVQYVYLQPTSGASLPILGKMYNYRDDVARDLVKNLNGQTDITFYLILLHEKSRGEVTLQSANPLDFPNINLNMFAEDEDVAVMTDGIEMIINLTKTEAFQQINATLRDFPICNDLEKYSKHFWECLIRNMATTLYHPCGTTAMGGDPGTSVVDSDLKVHGVGKLRVVDAGVFPSTISGNTNAPVVMVAEKIADVIKNEYNAVGASFMTN